MLLRTAAALLGVLSLAAAAFLFSISFFALTPYIEFQLALLVISGICGLIFAFMKNKFLTGGYAVAAVLIFSYIMAFSE